MKAKIFILCCSLPLTALADITPPKPNYSVLGKTVLDVNGAVSNDPQQVVKLSNDEANDTKTRLAAYKANLKNSWNKRHDGAVARAARNAKLVK